MLRMMILRVDTHVHASVRTGTELNGILRFTPTEWFNWDRAMQRAYGARYVLENTVLLEPIKALALAGG